MADLVASNVVVTVEKLNRSSELRQKRNRVKIVFGNGVLTYPAGGVPLPTFEKFGFNSHIDYMTMIDGESSNGLIWKYDKVNNKLRGYWPTGGGGAVPPVPAETDPIIDAGATPVVSASAAGEIDPGQGKEFVSATTTIASQTLFFEAVGW